MGDRKVAIGEVKVSGARDRTGTLDRGIWATWYDIPKEVEGEFLSWLHGKYLLEVSSRPGYLWGAHYEQVNRDKPREFAPWLTHVDDPSVPSGKEFILLFGAESSYVFMNPSLADYAQKESAETREMLGMRIGVRSGIFTEETRVEGPAAASRPPCTTPGPVILMGSFALGSLEDERKMGAWYAQVRLPDLTRMPGCIGARKLVSSAGWADHSMFHEFVSLDVMKQFPGPWNLPEGPIKERSIRAAASLLHAPGSPNTARCIWPAA